MKIINIFFVFTCIITVLCCKSVKNGISGEGNPCTHIAPFPEEEKNIFDNWYKIDLSVCENENITIQCKNSISRNGYFNKGKQNGKWLATTFFIPSGLGTDKAIRYMCREEYFKDGLRDSIYKIYDRNGKIIYSTYFKNGTGLEKDFHENGKLYYEIGTKDGYFVDTLKLYNAKGALIEKLLYKKDSLVYHKFYNKDE